jgi:sporulation protein YlmC with PRC-barrel domain
MLQALALAGCCVWAAAAVGQTGASPVQGQPIDQQAIIQAPGVLHYLAQRTQTQRLATSYLGKNVYGPDGQRIGDVNDLVVDTQPGGVPAIVIGVGGFLGLGEKDVAIPLGAVRSERIEGANRLVISVTRDDLRSAPTFVRGDPRQ